MTIKILCKKILITLIIISLALLMLELLLQTGALLVKGKAWRAKTHWLTGNIRVLALGDSNTYGLYLPAEDSYPLQLEKHWNTQHPELPIEIINLGYPGTNSFRLLANMPDILDTFKPDIVLLMIGFNDFWTPVETPPAIHEPSIIEKIKYQSRVYKLFYMLYQKKNIEITSGDRMLGGLSGINLSTTEITYFEAQTGLSFSSIPSQLNEIKKNPLLTKKIETAFQNILEERKKNPLKKDILNTVKAVENVFSLGIIDGDSSGNSRQMENNLMSMLQLLNQRKTDYFLINYPSNHGYYPAVNRKIEKVAAVTQSRFINIGNIFTESCRTKPESCPELFFYDGHATARGNQMISETVEASLESYLYQSRK